MRLLLQHLKTNFPESVDIKGKQLHSIWKRFSEVAKGRKVYFVCADIKDAFDSVDLRKLATILREMGDGLPEEMFISGLRVRTKNGRIIPKEVVSEKRGDFKGRQNQV